VPGLLLNLVHQRINIITKIFLSRERNAG
jgi:hypothetical protein